MAKVNATRTIGEASQYVVDELRNRGVRVNPTSRLGKYAAQFAKNAYTGPWGPEDQERLLEGLLAMRDVDEVAMILDEFPTTSKDDLQKLVDDSVIPRLDHATPGRDRQLELLVGAVCQRGRMPVRMDCEPDLWCEASRVWLGLAVKRVRSAKQFGANLEKASDQIQKSALSYGLVVMDVSLAWNPDLRTVLTQRTPGEVAHDYRERLTRFLDNHNVLMAETWEKYSKALGMLCIDLTFTHHEVTGWFRDQLSMFCFSHRDERVRDRLAKAFRSGWIRGSPNCIDMDGQPRTGGFSGPPVDKIMPLRPGSGA